VLLVTLPGSCFQQGSVLGFRVKRLLSSLTGSCQLQLPNLTNSVGRSVKMLLAVVSAVIPGFSLLDIHARNFCSLEDTYMFRNGASSSTREGSIFQCRRYVCFTVVYFYVCISALSQRPGHYGPYAQLVTAVYQAIFMQHIQRFSVNEILCSRLCLNLCNCSETAVTQLNDCRPNLRQV
jgi:hypothetical protein